MAKLKNIGIATYNYNGEDSTAPKRLGLIAEEAPEEVLSANKKGVDVYKLATFILAGVQEQQKRIESLELRLTNLETLVASSTQPTASGFSLQSITDYIASLTNLVVQKLTAKQELCVDDVCVDKEQFKALLAGAGISPTTSTTTPSDSEVGDPSSTEEGIGSGDKEAPVITVSGNNPANIAIGAMYNDLGASVSDNLDHNLGIKASLDGENWIEIGNITLNTASSTSYTVHYRAIDNAGNIGSAERAVVVGSGIEENTTTEEIATSTPTVIEEQASTEEATSTSSDGGI